MNATIFGQEDFVSYHRRVTAIYDSWRTAHEPLLREIDDKTLPKAVIGILSEDVLNRFSELPLLERYDVYQRLMDYWDDVMQDDVYLIAMDGWTEAAKPRGIIEDKAKKIKETPDLTIKRRKYKMDLIPPSLMVAKYFSVEQAAIETLEIRYETASRELEEFGEEHAGEDSLLEDAYDASGKISAASVRRRLKAICAGKVPDTGEEHKALTRCLELVEAKAEAARTVREAQTILDQRLLARYAALSESEIKTLVVGDKWFASLQVEIDGELQRLTQELAGRVRELDDRYAKPLPMLEEEVATLSERVDRHLRTMRIERL